MWEILFKIFYHTRVLTFLIFCVMLFFGIVGFYLFGNKSDDFSTVPLSIYSLFILLSTCNFPDVMLGTFSDDNRYPFFFFLLYLAINYFILFTLLKTLYYTHYFDSLKEEARKAIDAIYGEFHKNEIKENNILNFDEEESEGSLHINLLKPKSFTPFLALIGIGLYMFAKNDKKKNVGTILLGFSVLMFGMSSMSSAVSPLKDVDSFKAILTTFSNPIIGFLVGILFTMIIQSSAGTIGVLQALSKHLVQHHGKQDHHQRVGKGIDDIHNPHHDQVCSPAGIAGYGAVQQADDQNNQGSEETDRQGDPGAVDDPDKIVAAQFVRSENMREDRFAVVNRLLLQLGIRERRKILRALVPFPVYSNHTAVGIGYDQRSDNDRHQHHQQHNHGTYGQRITEQLAHTVPEEGGAFPHHFLLGFFFVRGRLKFRHIQLKAEGPFFRGNIGVIFAHFLSASSQSKSIRGSTSL